MLSLQSLWWGLAGWPWNNSNTSQSILLPCHFYFGKSENQFEIKQKDCLKSFLLLPHKSLEVVYPILDWSFCFVCFLFSLFCFVFVFYFILFYLLVLWLLLCFALLWFGLLTFSAPIVSRSEMETITFFFYLLIQKKAISYLYYNV